MNITQKSLCTLLGLGLIASLSNSVLANEQAAPKGECRHSWNGGHESGDSARFDKHMAALHDVLKLAPGQDAAWTEFLARMRPTKMDKPGNQNWKDLNTPDRLDRMLDNMKSREKQMTERAAAIRTFYGSLTEGQKKIFDQQFQSHHRRHDRQLPGKK